MKKELTCIICPQGCNIKVEIEENNIINVEGNGCKRGYEYAISEVKNPVRTLTTTIKLQNGKVIPVKTDKPIPKDMIFKFMEEINKHIVRGPVKIGDILIKNVLKTDVNIIATNNE